MQATSIPHQGLPRKGDLVRVKHAGAKTVSDQRYEVVTKGPGTRCTIRQWPSTAPKGKKMAEEVFDTTLLIVDNRAGKMFWSW